MYNRQGMLSQSNNALRVYFICRCVFPPQGTATYPGFPRPFPMDLPMRLPFRGDRGEDPKKPTDLVLEEQ